MNEQDGLPIQIDKATFRQGHEAFLRFMQTESNGVPFTNFGHRCFVMDETSYKQEALRRGVELLCFDKWDKWLRSPGRITAALKAICERSVFRNLMEYRFGDDGNSYSTLYRLSSVDMTRSFEQQVHALYGKSMQSEELFGQQVDVFADYLRINHLGCKWDFIAYLLFMMRPERCFPIRSTYFQKLLRFYGIDIALVGRVTWNRYRAILEVADALKLELSLYGSPTAIDIQSYMWVVSNLIEKAKDVEPPLNIDLAEELRKRQAKEREKQRIGFAGEQFVFEFERAKLIDAGRNDLANRVRWISNENESAGYDIGSFSVGGSDLHIEVKTTVQGKHKGDCFWLSGNEAKQASTDACWSVYRVWSVDSNPHCEDLGNIITQADCDWERQPSTWLVRRR